MANIKFERVTQKNLLKAINIGGTGFPGQLKELSQSLDSSCRPWEQWTLANAKKAIGHLNYYIVLVDGNPVGLTGMYTLKNAPKEFWGGWTCLIPSYCGRKYGKKIVKFLKNEAKKEGYTVIRFWVLGTPSNRFDKMSKMLSKMGFEVEEFPGQPNKPSYFVYSYGINGHQTTPCPAEAIMAGGCDHEIEETSRLRTLLCADEDYIQQNQKARQHCQGFLEEFGNLSNYINEDNRRLVELTSDIAKQCRNSLTESFKELYEKLFQIEAEREIVFPENGKNGLDLYVQPDKKKKYQPNERRIWAITDKQGNVVAAIIYNFVLLPKKLRLNYIIHGVLGITYLMVDMNYRQLGMGRALIDLAWRECAKFIKNTIDVDDPQIIQMTEQNDPMSITLEDAVRDLSGSCLGLVERQFLWGKLGQRKIEGFKYVQVSLRDGLEGLPLGLYVDCSQ